jgi:flotillin
MIIISVIIAVVVLVILFLSTYTVINPNEAHVVTKLGRGRKVYSPKVDTDGKTLAKTAYFYIPFLMKRQTLALTNIKLEINDIELHDKEVAPFLCDVVCWFHVVDPALATERLDLDHEEGTFGSVTESLKNLVPAVAREVAMKQEVLDIMRDRATFGTELESSVEAQIEKWGVNVVDLEINDIRDTENSNVISNYESIRQTQIQSSARAQNAERVREAIEAEQENKRKAEVKTAETEEIFRKRQIEKDKAIGISEANKDLEVAEQTEKANQQKVSAQRTLEVGQADIKAQAVVKVATGEADAVKIKGERQAEVTKLTGTAEANVVEAKGLAEAKAKDAMAEALKKFNESGITLEQIKAFVEVQKAKFSSLAQAFNAAHINLTSSDPQKIFGFGLDAEGGASLAQFIKTLETMTGKSATELIKEVKETVTGKDK